MEFNMSRLVNLMPHNTRDTPLSVEVRVYRRSLSQSEQDFLVASGCSSTMIQLHATVGEGNSKSGVALVSSASLRSCDMGSEQWMGFGNLSSLYAAWVRDNQSQFQTLTLSVKGRCGLQRLGFADLDGEEYEPLLVAYFAGSSERLGVINGAITSAIASSQRVAPFSSGRAKRDVTSCALHQYEYSANLCSGQCSVPIGSSDPLYPSEHAVFLYFLSTRNTAIAPLLRTAELRTPVVPRIRNERGDAHEPAQGHRHQLPSPMDSFKMLASRLAIISGKPKSVVLSELAQLASAPDGFDAVSVQNVGSTYIIVSWDLSTHSNGILINFSMYCNGALAGVLPLTVISYNTTGLLPFTLYMYMSSSHAHRHCTPVGTWCCVISAAASLPSTLSFQPSQHEKDSPPGGPPDPESDTNDIVISRFINKIINPDKSFGSSILETKYPFLDQWD
eukprot:Em0002g1168a